MARSKREEIMRRMRAQLSEPGPVGPDNVSMLIDAAKSATSEVSSSLRDIATTAFAATATDKLGAQSGSMVPCSAEDLMDWEEEALWDDGHPSLLLSEEEQEEMLVLMEAELMRDLEEEEQRLMSLAEQHVVHEDADAQQSLAEYDAGVGSPDSDEVLCPVCKQHPLTFTVGRIACHCGVALNTELDHVNPAGFLRRQLADLLGVHS